jgi:hypothetical protein
MSIIRLSQTALSMLIVLSAGCSGFIPSLSKGEVVRPSYLLQFCGGGSLSTLWYLGSDDSYHYFAHYVKSSTNYRVRRVDLKIPFEFPYKKREAVSVGDAGFWEDIREKGPNQRPERNAGAMPVSSSMPFAGVAHP